MVVPVLLPRLGMSMKTALVAEWYQPDGAPVHVGDLVFRLETDYVAVDVEAESNGVLRHRTKAGQALPAGEVVAMILGAGERMPASPATGEQADAPHEPDRESARPATGAPPPDALPVMPPLPGNSPGMVPSDRELFEPVLLFPRRMTEAAAPPAPPVEAEPPQSEAPVVEDAIEQVSAWDPIPGDAQDFASEWPGTSMRMPQGHDFGQEPRRVLPAGPNEPAEDEDGTAPAEAPAVEALVEEETPFGEEESGATFAIGDEGADPGESWAEADSPTERRLALSAPSSVNSLRATVAMSEALKMRDQLVREWSGSGIRPATEDIVLRAVARAVVETGASRRRDDLVGLRVLRGMEQPVYVLPGADSRHFRDAVASMAALVEEAGPGSDHFQATLTSLEAFGIDDSVPHLEEGQALAFSMGAVRSVPEFDGEHLARARVMTLTLAYDGRLIPEAAAAHLLARVRDLVEAPYALLVA